MSVLEVIGLAVCLIGVGIAFGWLWDELVIKRAIYRRFWP